MEEEESLPPKTPKEQTQEHLLKQMVDDTKDKKWVNIPEAKGNWRENLWSMVEKAKQGSNIFDSAPIEEVHIDPNPLDFDENSIYGYIGSVKSQESQHKFLKELPQYLGEHEARSEIKVLPSIQGKPNHEKDTMILTNLLSTQIGCRLTLGELLKVRPQLWNDLMGTL